LFHSDRPHGQRLLVQVRLAHAKLKCKGDVWEWLRQRSGEEVDNRR